MLTRRGLFQLLGIGAAAVPALALGELTGDDAKFRKMIEMRFGRETTERIFVILSTRSVAPPKISTFCVDGITDCQFEPWRAT